MFGFWAALYYSYFWHFATNKVIDDMNWIKYNFMDITTRPKRPGKYFVHRKDGKVHWEQWNGSGWAYNEKVITHWAEITPPEE